MVTESTGPKTTARAFSYLTSSLNVAMISAPILGGGLYGAWGSSSRLLRDYPAFLPCLTSCILGLLSMTLVLIFVKEVSR